MEIKGIDVSAWQGKIDWKTVADYGMGFAILRITEQGNKVDSQFENNYIKCKNYGIPVGVYKYSYAKTAAQAQEEAEAVLNVLNGRKIQFPVFYDLEWSEQRSLGKTAIEKIAVAFLEKIQAAGYKVGVYCNVDWYNEVLTDALKKYDLWIARYPANDDGWMQERLRPDFGVGWQYSSKAKIPGISGNVDRNVFYKDYTDDMEDDEEEGTGMTKDEAIQAVIGIAEEEIGYLEKRSNSNLDSKTANAGSNNYTKYWRDTYPQYQGKPWCADFVSWCLMKAFGLDNAKKLLKHWPYVYCPTLGSLFTKYANPQVGDIVIFYRKGTFAHTGIVTKVSGDRFWTIEGNTSGASGIIENGGGVCAKSYYNSQLPGTKFCRPDYSIVANAGTTEKPNTPTTGTGGNYMFETQTVKSGSTGLSVLLLQEILKARGFKGKDGKELELDRSAGTNTIYALTQYQKSRGGYLEVDGICGPATWKDLIAL